MVVYVKTVTTYYVQNLLGFESIIVICFSLLVTSVQ